MTVEDLFETRNGYTPAKSNVANWTDGTIPWFRMEDIRENGRILNSATQLIPATAVKGGRLFPADSLIVATSATIGEHALITVPFMANQRFTVLWVKPRFLDRCDIKFLFYYCFVLDEWCRNNTTTSSFASVDMAGFKRFRFPLPPVEIQKEIVNALDTFSKLESELESELEARRHQYDYYRHALMSSTSSQPQVAVVELTHSVASGRNKTRSDSGLYPVHGSTGRIGSTDHAVYFDDSILVARVGANAGRVNIVTGEYDVTDNTIVVMPNDQWDLRFAFHQLTQMNLNQYAVGGGQPLITGSFLKALEVRLPSLVDQRKIAASLDKFDALVNDLSVGLPAEIKARRRQYEHYRDRLLTFKEAA